MAAKYISKEILTLQGFVELMESLPLKKHRGRKLCWLKLIQADKLVCPSTGLKVAYCSLDEQQNTVKSLHYNFYSECGKFMTIDHIHPKSKGGHKTALHNIQPMESEANSKKADKILVSY